MSFSHRLLLVSALLGGLLLGQDNPYQNLLDNHAQAVVTIKAVQTVTITVPGRGAQEEETKLEVRGVVVDAAGMIMVSDSALNNSALLRMLNDPRFELDIRTDDIVVVFENEEKEYGATLVATDSELDMAFIKIDELEGRELAPLDFAAAETVPAVGDEVFAVTRTGRSFDFAPHFVKVQINGKIKKPRKLYGLAGMVEPGLPLFHLDGSLLGVGIVVVGADTEEGGMLGQLQGGQGAGLSVMLLPAKKVQALIERAQQQAADLDETAPE